MLCSIFNAYVRVRQHAKIFVRRDDPAEGCLTQSWHVFWPRNIQDKVTWSTRDPALGSYARAAHANYWPACQGVSGRLIQTGGCRTFSSVWMASNMAIFVHF